MPYGTSHDGETIWIRENGDRYPLYQDERGNYIQEFQSKWKTYVDETPCAPDIMPHLIVSKRMSKEIPYHGVDAPEHCKCPRDVFEAWPNGDKISYAFNSRGFRDTEWPDTIEEMRDAIWLVGDSFTMGMGIAFEESYKRKLERATGKKVVDISLDGTNPNWRRRIAIKIIKEVGPQFIILHWGYMWRYKRKYRTLAQEVRNTIFQNQEQSCMEGFVKTFKSMYDEPKGNTTVIHNFLPKFAGQNKSQEWVVNEIQKFTGVDNPYIVWDNEQLDTGRDGWHFGPKTIDKYIENNLKKLHNLG